MERNMLDYLPHVLREVRDFRCLAGQYQKALETLWQLERATEDNFYLFTADERGLVHWEYILGIVPREGAGIKERRQVIAARISQTTPYCWETFLAFLTALAGSEGYAAERAELTLTVWLRPAWRSLRDAVWTLMRHIVPANIEMRLILVYNTHGDLRAFTHRKMGAYTHAQLRNEVKLV